MHASAHACWRGALGPRLLVGVVAVSLAAAWCLRGSVKKKKCGFVEKVTGLLPSGSLCVNDTMKQFSQLQLPLGGVGQSGSGRYRGRFGVEALSYEKSVTKRYFVGKDLMEMMPPYEKAFRWIKKFMR